MRGVIATCYPGVLSVIMLFALQPAHAMGESIASTALPAPTCAISAAYQIEDVSRLSAILIAQTAEHPEYCRIVGYVRPATRFEIRLPTTWNGKFYVSGCGGLCGLLDGEAAAIGGRYYALARGYAVALTDTGHSGRDISDASWAYNNPQAREDYAYRAIAETTRVGKLITRLFYDRPIARSYFHGCSNGGRQALIEAQRFPTDFDGIIAGCAVTDMTGFVAQWIWNAQVDTGRDGKPIFDVGKLPILANAVKRRCAGNDGVISDPRRCAFDPDELRCRRGVRANCLSTREVAIVRAWYQGPRLKSGKILHEGLPKGSEREWAYFVAGHAGIDMLMRDYVRYLIVDSSPGVGLAVDQFQLDSDLERAQPMLRKLSADNTDLSKFRERGGKLLLYHGWADSAATPGNIVAYYEKAWHRASDDEFRDHVRLFMVPGMGHVPTGIDPLTALERWVEHGETPVSILQTKSDAVGNVIWSRPVCAYPTTAAYLGGADNTRADRWTCN